MTLAYVALGANLGQPVDTLRAAFVALGELADCRLCAISSLYRTAPIGLTAQPDFINAVACLDTQLSPTALLTALQGIENVFGRERLVKDGPRTLDLDLLLHGDSVLNLPSLQVPHPRLHLRAFVLVPLAEIAPDLQLPGRGQLAAWLPAVANQAIERLPTA